MAFNTSPNKVRLRTATQLANHIESYITLKNKGNEPAEFAEENALVLFLDTSALFHDLDTTFDGFNWSLIYDYFVPQTVVAPPAEGAARGTAGGTAGGAAGASAVDPDVERVSRAT